MANDYFYHEQIRRYHLQFNRIFSSFKWKTGINKSGGEEYRTVPCIPASSSRHVASLMKGGKENSTNTIPQFATYIEEVKIVPERRQEPEHVRSLTVSERKLDEVTGRYTSEIGNQYTIESIMPVPYDLIMKCDLITSNTMQKHQLMEQIMVLFNPMIDLQTSRNSFDWTSLGIVMLENIDWSNSSFPQESEEYDVVSMTFVVRAWISAPSKVKQQTIIHEIITNIGEVSDIKDAWQDDGTYYAAGATLSQIVTTPGNCRINIESSGIQNQYIISLLNNNAVDFAGEPLNWMSLLTEYGKTDLDNSQLIIIDEYDGLDTGIIRCAGTIDFNSDQTKLIWNINPSSLPPLNSRIPNVVAVIDPNIDYPGAKNFKTPVPGDRYVVMGPLYQRGSIWGDILYGGQLIPTEIAATDGDVIEYDGSNWTVILDAEKQSHLEIWSFDQSVLDYIHFSKGNWTKTLEGEYKQGNWRLKL